MRCLPPMFALALGCLNLLPAAAQPPKPTLQLQTAAGQTTFHIGERISLKLTLTGSDNKKFSIDTAGYDRSGRLDIDSFEVSPAIGWADPLAQYFSQGMFDGGGLRGSDILSSKPVSFQADLNEHIRFDQPGTYSIVATSHRVGVADKNGFPREPFLTLLSNPVEIHIVPATAEWQAAKLRSIVAILDAPVKQRNGWPSEGRLAAEAELRFLNSPASIELLASSLRDDSENKLMWASALGLAGVPESMRDIAIHAMSRKLDDPAFPVSHFFLTIMAHLESSPHDSGAAPPKTFADLLPSHRPEFKSVWHQALADLPRKQGAALASTAETLLSSAPDGEAAEVRTQIATVVASSFIALPIDRQIPELEYNWDELSKEPMMPVLQALLHQPPTSGGSPFYSTAELNAMVLKRWFELDPEGAVHEVTLQLASPNAAFTPESVRKLPGGSQPQFEAAWARELSETEDNNRQTLLAAMLVRFGTGSAKTEIEAKLDSLVGKWACDPQAASLAYVVKFNSDSAVSLIRRAMASTHETQCYESLFSAVSAYAHGAALNEVALDALQNPDPNSAADAAQYLRYFGTESSKQPLLERYRQWTERWAGNPGALDPSTESGYPLGMLGLKLAEALIANQGWLADPRLIAEVLSRCIGDEMCKQLHNLASEASSSKPHVCLNRSAPMESYEIGQYDLKSLELFEAKLAQFPAGSKFSLIPTSPRNGDQLKLEKEVEALFTKHGMTLEVPAPAPTTVN